MRSVEWYKDKGRPGVVRMIDQRLLPVEFRLLELEEPEDVARAIRDMAVRGAPAIGATAGFGMALAAHRSQAGGRDGLLRDLEQAAAALLATRPTAVNLTWAVERVLERAADEQDVERVRAVALEEAQSIADEDVAVNRRLGQTGAAIVPEGATILHHCNTGALATVDYGTALGVIRAAHEAGKRIHVLVDETRPRLQGARLTAWELQQAEIPFTLIADNAAGHFMRTGQVEVVLVGADRVAANGDVANKIGTYKLAVVAKENGVPFYPCVPTSTIDLSTPTGDDIPIEERPSEEITGISFLGRQVVPEGARVANPAFDVTPHRYVTGIVTENGIAYPPFATSLRQVMEASFDS
ncbi:MAG: S-methyl-5-thioribose-1-phosphate isomerase [Chloroflexi bacterium]|nr:MAG: S-methyl-5-thioribose-1-phosphate isomerase [Anaerolineaceae bacterium 4572_32.2]RLC80854.1 MAG: S-methyl-5-thioribose-1-phosphate isomerase [Chloroflexota bacterium]RLC87012.1 MAG: S-methyl-5-thioribose-1-phosphate isomerase [Chloroflexota bacterium]HEY73962.1 S-methyl-5-thioribose-1-phosphate isomerase [Thermoflexia bacterium]